MTTLKQLKAINTLRELDKLGIGNLRYEIGNRGGNMGFYGSDVAEHFNINPNMLPSNFGAYSNYLGGGIRGAITASDFNTDVPKNKAVLLIELGEACKRAYLDCEDENSMNDELDENGDTNWDAMATRANRAAGIVSAY